MGAAVGLVPALVRHYHERGWSDYMLAAHALAGQPLAGARSRVQRCRRKLGLPPHPSGRGAVKGPPPAPVRERLRAALDRTLRRDGYKSLAQVRADADRRAAASQGWPAGATPHAAAVLAALRHGPRTAGRVAGVLCGGDPPPSAVRAAERRLRRLARPAPPRRLDVWVVPVWCVPAGQRRRRRIWELAPDVLAGRRRWEAGRRR
jgi:hypothetical protein